MKTLKDITLTDDQAALISACINHCSEGGPLAHPKQSTFGFFYAKWALECVQKMKPKMNEAGTKIAEECETLLA